MLVDDARSILVTSCRDFLALLGMDAARDPAGTDLLACLDLAIVAAAQACGLTAATPTACIDPDLLALPQAREPRFRARARIELLKVLRDRASSRTDQTIGLDSYRYSQAAQRLAATVASEEAAWERDYVLAGMGPVVVGPICDRYGTPGHRRSWPGHGGWRR